MHHIQLILKFFLQKKHKNNKGSSNTIRRDELVFNSVRFGKSLTFDSFTVANELKLRLRINALEKAKEENETK